MTTTARPVPKKPTPPPLRGGWFYGGVSLTLFVVGYLIAVWLLFPPLPVPKDGVAVPDLRGLTIKLAADKLAPLGLETGDTVTMPHLRTPMGVIVAQTPLPGQQLRAGGRVSLGLSAGPPSVMVPALLGLGGRRAQNLLKRMGFEVDQIMETSAEPNGTVIRSTPDAGVRLPLPARVLIYVSAGPPDSLSIPTTTTGTTTTTGVDTLRLPR
jgi:eukaryotic-like serine/threonine-protein kinase